MEVLLDVIVTQQITESSFIHLQKTYLFASKIGKTVFPTPQPT